MKCLLCPRKCGIDRTEYKGYCRSDESVRIARAALHHWEEPCVSGSHGSGTVFFSGCSLQCNFCQNSVISHHESGKRVTDERLYEILFELKDKGAHNINLVTADHYLPYILPVLKRAKSDRLNIPILLNTSSYLIPETVYALDGAVDGFIADFKFFTSAPADKYCNAPDYPDIARAAIDSMVELTGAPVLKDGLLQSGVIVRIPVLPTCIIDAKRSIKYIADRFGDKVILSVMSQYTPMPQCTHAELSRPLNQSEYKSILKYVENLGIDGYVQQYGANGERYIPHFNCEGV